MAPSVVDSTHYHHLHPTFAPIVPHASFNTEFADDSRSNSHVGSDSHSPAPSSGFGTPVPVSSQPTTTTPSQESFFCFGQLPNLTISCSSSSDLDNLSSTSLVSLRRKGQEIYVIDPSSNIQITRLGRREGIILGSLIGCADVDLHCNLLPTSSAATTSQTRYRPKKPAKSALLSITVYGTEEVSQDIGDYLAESGVFLQLPLRALCNVKYYNPQSLSINLHDAPMTFDLQQQQQQHVLQFEHVDSLSAIDPSATLETVHHLSETDTPHALRTPLFTHQRQALSFMLKREDTSRLMSEPFRHNGNPPADDDQVDQVSKSLDTFRGGILADSMGLGKTLSIIALIAHQASSDLCRTSSRRAGTLVVVTLSLLKTWEEQLRLHVRPDSLSWYVYYPSRRPSRSSPDLSGFNIVITTYDVVASLWRKIKTQASPLHRVHWCRIILDEAHEIRSKKTLRFDAVSNLRCSVRWALTGTPIQNSTDDLASLLVFLRAFPQDVTFARLKRLCLSIADDPIIRSVLTSVCLRRSKASVSLPERIDTVRHVTLGEDEKNEYAAIRDDIERSLPETGESVSRLTRAHALVQINALRQVCNLGLSRNRPLLSSEHQRGSAELPMQDFIDAVVSAGPSTCAQCGHESTQDFQSIDDNLRSEYRILVAPCGAFICATCANDVLTDQSMSCSCSANGVCIFSSVNLEPSEQNAVDALTVPTSSKVNALTDSIVGMPSEDKALVFSFWVSTLDMAQQALHRAGIATTRLEGSMDANARSDSIDRFSSDPSVRVLLISLRCGSSGLNLTAANHVFLMEPSWNPAMEEQALCRAHRIGQTKPVHAVRFIVAASIEERIRDLQARKKRLMDQAFGGLGQGKNWVERVRTLTQDTHPG